MALALATSSRLKPEIRLSRAISAFKASLSTEQKVAFFESEAQTRLNPPGISDVMRVTAEIDRKASGKVGGQCVGPRLTNFLQAVQQYAALGDVLVGGSQNLIACGLWAVVRMSLLSVVNISSYLDKLSESLMAIGRSAPRYQMLGVLYPKSPRLQSFLSEYYIVVVRLCQHIVEFGQKSAITRYTSSVTDNALRPIQSDLETWAMLVKDEVDVLLATVIHEEGKNNAKFRAWSRKESSSVEVHRNVERKIRILGLCSSYDHQTAWKQARKSGTSTIFASNTQYQDWKNRKGPRTVVYKGKLGSGKSVLLANIVDDLNLHVKNEKDATVAYFFCRHDIAESLKARTVFGSLAQQLLRNTPESAFKDTIEEKAASFLDVDDMAKLIMQHFPSSSSSYFILDGVDELQGLEKQYLIQRLTELQEHFADFRICLSYRTGSNEAIDQVFATFSEVIVTSIPDVNPDIASYIHSELEQRVRAHSLVVGQPNLVADIRDALISGSQGMFLWVHLQIECICIMKTDDSIRKALADLPKDLSQTYARILSRYGEEFGRLHQREILELMIAAFRPLTTEEMREALSVLPGKTTRVPERVHNDIYSTLACCGPLLTIDEEESTVRFIHESLQHFLLSSAWETAGFNITPESGHQRMLGTLSTYLCYADFETQLSKATLPQALWRASPTHIISTIPASSSVRKMALKLIPAQKGPDYDVNRILIEARKLAGSRQSVQLFPLFSYADSYCLMHALECSTLEDVYYRLLRKLLQKRRISFHGQDGNENPLLCMAAHLGRTRLIQLLVECPEFDLAVANSDKETPIICAARSGHVETVELLLNLHGMDKATMESAKKRDIDGFTAMTRACIEGHRDVAKTLLKSGFSACLPDLWGCTPLAWACRQGHTVIVSDILERGDGSNLKDEHGRTPLSWAAELGHSDIVRLLLESPHSQGWGSNDVDHRGRTPLIWASMSGHCDVVELLLQSSQVQGWIPNDKDQEGNTPLMCALTHGHFGVVDLLLASSQAEGWFPNGKQGAGMNTLLWALQKGHFGVVEMLLRLSETQGWNPNVGDYYTTPLIWALFMQHYGIAKSLIEHSKVHYSSSLNDTDSDGRTALMWACRKAHRDILELLSEEVDTSCIDESGRTHLSWAAEEGHHEIVKFLIDSGYTGPLDYPSRRSEACTPLACAARNGHTSVVELLLSLPGLSPVHEDDLGRGPISYAARHGHAALVQWLLDCPGVAETLSSEDKTGCTPFTWACKNAHLDIADVLLKKMKVEHSLGDLLGDLPDSKMLMSAVKQGHGDVVKIWLTHRHIDLNKRDDQGRTLLLKAAECGRADVIDVLASLEGLDLNLPTLEGRTPVSLAAKWSNEAALRKLVQLGADPHLRDHKGKDAFHWARKRGVDSSIIRLMENAHGTSS